MKNFENMKKAIKEFSNGYETMKEDLKTKGRRHKQIANLITLSRVLLACFIPPLAISGGMLNLILATIITGMAAVTDGIDGFIARKLDAVSEFGKNLDPVCDKIFVTLLLVPLMAKLSPLMALGLGANLVLEAGITGVNLNSKSKGNVPRTTILGKIKTWLLYILLASLYLSFSYQAMASIIPIIYALTTAAQALTLGDYYRIDRNKDKEKEKTNSSDEPTIETKSGEESVKDDKEKNKDKENKPTIKGLEDLKASLGRMYPKPTDEKRTDEQQTQQDGFQKIK